MQRRPREVKPGDGRRDVPPPGQSGSSSHPERTRTGSSHVEPSTQRPEMRAAMRAAESIGRTIYNYQDRPAQPPVVEPPKTSGMTHPDTWQPKGRTIRSVIHDAGSSRDDPERITILEKR